jgi:thiamine pyrophosphokinase
MLDIQRYKSILCLNGDLPHQDFFKLNLPIIAADGAINRLTEMQIKPSIVIGDLDSAEPELLELNQILHLPSQESSDYQKCLQYLSDQKLLPAIVTGINGGHLDHILNNINIFLDTDSLLYAPPVTGFCVRANHHINVTTQHDTKISLIGIPHAIVSTSGLKWELNTQTLTFPGKNSCFNRTQHDSIQIHVHQGQLLVLVYQSKMQDAGSNTLTSQPVIYPTE